MDQARKLSRRSFLTARVAPIGGIPPPGVSRSSLDACTGCGSCVEACPTGIISLVRSVPTLDFTVGECTFCAECRKACPEPVFISADPPRRFPHAVAISEACFAKSGIACQSCRDACPEQAIRFRPRIGGPFIPELDEDACSGCGACIGVCPASAIAVSERERGEIHA